MNLIRIRSACFFALVVGLFCLAACADSSILSGKLCDEGGRCLEGYVCDPATNRCVPEGQLPDGDSGDAGDGGLPDGGDVLEVDRLPVFMLDPSNLDGPIADLMCGSAQALVLNGDATIDTESGVISGPEGDADPEKFQVVRQPGEYWPDLAVFTFDRVEIAAGARVTATGANALVILACSEIRIFGVLDVSGSSGVMTGDAIGTPGRGGPGGSVGGDKNGGDGLGFGGGQGGAEAECNVDRDSGGAGGGFGGVAGPRRPGGPRRGGRGRRGPRRRPGGRRGRGAGRGIVGRWTAAGSAVRRKRRGRRRRSVRGARRGRGRRGATGGQPPDFGRGGRRHLEFPSFF